MAKSSFDPDGYQRLQKDYEKVMAAFGDLYQNVTGSAVSEYINNYRGGSELSQAVENFKATQQKAIDMESILQKYFEMMTGTMEEGNRNMSSVDTPDANVPKFSEMEVSSKSDRYNGYISYQWSEAGLDFSSNYNDMYSFIQSSGYINQSNWKTGSSEYNNWELFVKGMYATITGDMSALDYYTDELLENSLISVMDSLAGADAMAIGLNGKMKEVTGVSNWDDWVSQIKDLIKWAAENGIGYDAFYASEKYIRFIDKFDMEDQKIIRRIMEMTANKETLDKLAERAGQTEIILDWLKWSDPLFKCLKNEFTDYSRQISYLDTMQEAMLSAGYPYGAVHKAINNIRKRYDSALDNMVNEYKGLAKKQIAKWGTKIVGEFDPVFGGVNKGLSFISNISKLANYSDIKADKALMGLQQYDRVLTSTYSKYQQMIKDGIASQADMKEADRIFKILCSTKQQEYQNMMTLCKEGTAEYNRYLSKYNELTEWLKKANQ